MAQSFIDTLGLRLLMFLELDGWQHRISDMLAFWVAKHFAVVDRVLSRFIASVLEERSPVHAGGIGEHRSLTLLTFSNVGTPQLSQPHHLCNCKHAVGR